jgi:predicted dehydrogenase/threonine dehydrogenase-like Zn-dependent dehydrogenase
MKQILTKKGNIVVGDIPAPVLEDDRILVEVAYSFISSGTEISDLKNSGMSLVERSWKQPENVIKALNGIKAEGFLKTYSKIRARLDDSRQTGYSCSGVIIDVGKNIRDLRRGDQIACAGFGLASHAEVVSVPRNLVVKIPDGCGLAAASSVALGAIAVQGVRRADNRFGETVVVLGLGLIGQIVVQLLTNAGCRVIGSDKEPRRIELAKKFGAKAVINVEKENAVQVVLNLTDYLGADSTIISAVSESDTLCQQAMEMTRKKGKVVVLGDVGLNLKRSPFYEKEIDFLISCSYGPGRYDRNYEEKGLDYPQAYVRWTENRNMEEYLRQISENRINFATLAEKEFPLDQAEEAYKELEKPNRPLGILFKYNLNYPSKEYEQKLHTSVTINLKSKKDSSRFNVALVGPGSFAQETHLTNLHKLQSKFNIYAIVSRSGVNAKNIGNRYNAKLVTTNYQDVLNDAEVEAVLICTRHNLHAKFAIEALNAGKHVFVEKPLALNERELDELINTYNNLSVKPILMVGFNRRFSPFAARARKITSGRINPLIITYRMNAGFISPDHWIHSEEGGGRIIGEACHIYDLFNFFTNSKAETVDVSAISPRTEHLSARDNFNCTIKYSDGSICSLLYTSLGNSLMPKEYCEIYFDGKVITIDDYSLMTLYGIGKGTQRFRCKRQEKGHFEELIAFEEAIKTGKAPISIDEMVRATELTFLVERMIC